MSRITAISFKKHNGVKQTGTIIFFHGSGGTGVLMMQWVDLMVKNFSFPHLKILYPTAPLQPYTPAAGEMRNVWFDRIEVNQKVPENKTSLAEIETEIKNVISKEVSNGIPANRIIVGGFSMGGALALHTAYRWVPNLAAAFVFSSFLNENSSVYEELRNTNGNVPPLLQIHGNIDNVVDLAWAETTFEQLKALKVQGEFHVIDRLGHSINKKGLNLIHSWIEKHLPEI